MKGGKIKQFFGGGKSFFLGGRGLQMPWKEREQFRRAIGFRQHNLPAVKAAEIRAGRKLTIKEVAAVAREQLVTRGDMDSATDSVGLRPISKHEAQLGLDSIERKRRVEEREAKKNPHFREGLAYSSIVPGKPGEITKGYECRRALKSKTRK